MLAEGGGGFFYVVCRFSTPWSKGEYVVSAFCGVVHQTPTSSSSLLCFFPIILFFHFGKELVLHVEATIRVLLTLKRGECACLVLHSGATYSRLNFCS